MIGREDITAKLGALAAALCAVALGAGLAWLLSGGSLFGHQLDIPLTGDPPPAAKVLEKSDQKAQARAAAAPAARRRIIRKPDPADTRDSRRQTSGRADATCPGRTAR